MIMSFAKPKIKIILSVVFFTVFLVLLFIYFRNSKQGSSTPTQNSTANTIESSDAQTPTPHQLEGPYYPIEKPIDRDWNLRLITNSTMFAVGEPVKMRGRLLSSNNVPLIKYEVEIWQADDDGIYNHPRDPRASDKDLYFQSYGEVITDEEGVFYFETILPGHYGNRPRHIHVKVKDPKGREQLTTQLYFYGDQYLDTDAIYLETPDRELLVMKLYEETDNQIDYSIGEIDIILP